MHQKNNFKILVTWVWCECEWWLH